MRQEPGEGSGMRCRREIRRTESAFKVGGGGDRGRKIPADGSTAMLYIPRRRKSMARTTSVSISCPLLVFGFLFPDLAMETGLVFSGTDARPPRTIFRCDAAGSQSKAFRFHCNGQRNSSVHRVPSRKTTKIHRRQRRQGVNSLFVSNRSCDKMRS